MRRVSVKVAAICSAAALGALAATSMAGGGSDELVLSPQRSFEPHRVQEVHRPADATQLRAAPRRKRGQKATFLQTEPVPIAAESEEGARLKCPKRFKAVGAYFASSEPGTLLGLSAPSAAIEAPDEASKRSWLVAAFNASGADDRVIFGVVCINKLK